MCVLLVITWARCFFVPITLIISFFILKFIVSLFKKSADMGDFLLTSYILSKSLYFIRQTMSSRSSMFLLTNSNAGQPRRVGRNLFN